MIEKLCVQGNPTMEDRVGGGERWLFVIDGASGLTDCHVTEGESDAAWLAEGLCQGLERLLPFEELSLDQILQQIADELRAQYDLCWQEKKGKGVPDYPSAGVAILRLRKDMLEYLGIGDCTVTVENSDGTVEVLSETKLTALDQDVIKKMEQLRAQTGCTVLQARQKLNDLLIHNRNRRNHPDGYWIFDPSGEGISCARRNCWPVSDIRSVCAMTDGLAQYVNPFKLAESEEELHIKVTEKGLSQLTAELLACQQADADCSRYPRFKTTDDIAAIWAAL